MSARIFVIPGRGDTVRINGRARILSDADYFDDLAVKGKRPILALEVHVDEVFFHCSKAFLRSNAWQPETWTPGSVPKHRRCWPSPSRPNRAWKSSRRTTATRTIARCSTDHP